MKKILSIIAVITISLTACADRQHLIEYSDLPAQAQTFIKTYFNLSDVSYIESEREGLHTEYKVYLKNATEIEFDQKCNLENIDCRISPVPEGIVPEVIISYLQNRHPDDFVVEYAIGFRYLKVELSNGLELLFDLEGKFVRVDD